MKWSRSVLCVFLWVVGVCDVGVAQRGGTSRHSAPKTLTLPLVGCPQLLDDSEYFSPVAEGYNLTHGPNLLGLDGSFRSGVAPLLFVAVLAKIYTEEELTRWANAVRALPVPKPARTDLVAREFHKALSKLVNEERNRSRQRGIAPRYGSEAEFLQATRAALLNAHRYLTKLNQTGTKKVLSTSARDLVTPKEYLVHTDSRAPFVSPDRVLLFRPWHAEEYPRPVLWHWSGKDWGRVAFPMASYDGYQPLGIHSVGAGRFIAVFQGPAQHPRRSSGLWLQSMMIRGAGTNAKLTTGPAVELDVDGAFQGLAVSPNGKHVAVVAQSCSPILLNSKTLESVAIGNALPNGISPISDDIFYTGITFSPDSRSLLVATEEGPTVTSYSVPQMKIQTTTPKVGVRPEDSIETVLSGELLPVTQRKDLWVYADRSLWQVGLFKDGVGALPAAILKSKNVDAPRGRTFQDAVKSVAVHPERAEIASILESGNLALWQVGTNGALSLSRQITIPRPDMTTGPQGPTDYASVAYSSRGNYLIVTIDTGGSILLTGDGRLLEAFLSPDHLGDGGSASRGVMLDEATMQLFDYTRDQVRVFQLPKKL
jgi:hypothetical protein